MESPREAAISIRHARKVYATLRGEGGFPTLDLFYAWAPPIISGVTSVTPAALT